MCLHAQSLQLCLTLCNPINCSLPPYQSSSVHMIILGRTLEWVANSSSRESSWSRDWTRVPPLQVDSVSLSHLGSPYMYMYLFFFYFFSHIGYYRILSGFYIFFQLCYYLFLDLSEKWKLWREVQEGGNICVPIADSCWCMAETNTIL